MPAREVKELDQRVSEEHACIFVPSCLAVSQGVGGAGWVQNINASEPSF